jgi:hypothetical protein
VVRCVDWGWGWYETSWRGIKLATYYRRQSGVRLRQLGTGVLAVIDKEINMKGTYQSSLLESGGVSNGGVRRADAEEATTRLQCSVE